MLDCYAVLAPEAVEAVKPFGQAVIKLYRAPAFHDAFASQGNAALLRLFYHDIHIRQYLVHMLFLGVAVCESPEIRGLHANARNELILLHILCAKRAVEVIEYRRNRSFSGHLKHLRKKLDIYRNVTL